ncbi:MAG: thioredoxin domain-containing protein, partial [Actinomycetota bacterium]|nr:thioredoxin domain-containing protein [Actinomycetota bacterium]
MSNRLEGSTSPYLLQHEDNPVEWWPWGSDAFAEAERRDVPVLLSIGYAACHWCHVMAHESFEDASTAAYMNENFVNVKVDREERPDVDAVYMTATQAMTGQGGWPMTCVLTHGGEPFFCGTYFPDLPRQGMPAFGQVLQALVDAWQNRRDEVTRIGAEVVERLQAATATVGAEGGDPLQAPELDAAVDRLAESFDAQVGGFGAAPKFPPSMVLEHLLRQHARTEDAGSLAMVSATCRAMARGGVYDQLAGGFARYSVDRSWVVPHFEKMLYDNAQLARVYLHWWRATGDPLGARVVAETADFCIRELGTGQGGFASALDADSLDPSGVSVEGAFYAWRPAQLREVLGEQDCAWAARLLEVTEAGTFEHGFSTLQMHTDADDAQRWERVRGQLLEAREHRARPTRDDKVVAAWNGLMISALVEAGVLLGRPDLLSAGVRAGDLLWSLHVDADGTLWRTSRDGRRGDNRGVLEDHGCVAAGFLALLGATGDPVWLERSGALLDRALDVFADGSGGFYDTAADAEQLVLRPRDASDNASPSGVSSLADALLTYAAVTGSGRHHDAARAAVASA